MARSNITTRLISACELFYGTPTKHLAKRRYLVGIAVRQQLNQMNDRDLTDMDCLTMYDWADCLHDGFTIFGFNAEALLSQASNAWHLQPHRKPHRKPLTVA